MLKRHLTTALAAILLASGGELHAQLVVLSSSVQEHTADPGERHTGEIRIRNASDEARGVRVYQTDYSFQADGSSSYDPPGTEPRSNAGWMTVAPTDLVLEPGQEGEITYTVAVPADATLAGTYWSMVMIEPTADPREDLEARSEPALGIRATVRFAIQVATHVPGEAEHRLSLGNPQVVLDDAGERTLQFELVNTGEVGYRPKVSLEVFDRDGGLAMTMEAQRGLIYPGTSALQRFELSELPAGSFQAVVVVDTGSLEVFGAQFNLTVGADD